MQVLKSDAKLILRRGRFCGKVVDYNGLSTCLVESANPRAAAVHQVVLGFIVVNMEEVPTI
jgi:hypothetical protein